MRTTTRRITTGLVLVGLGAVLGLAPSPQAVAPAIAQEVPEHSVAREWNEALLEAIRGDFARPTVHARNLFHVSVAMWDAWAAFDPDARGFLYDTEETANDVHQARDEAISYASYRIIAARFADSPGAAETQERIDALMETLGYDPRVTRKRGKSAAAVGNRIAATILAFGSTDGANEENGYANRFYEPVNDPLLPAFPGNPDITDVNRWQPLALDFFVDQGGNPLPTGTPEFLSPEWGTVRGFALTPDDRTIYVRDGDEYWVHHDPGAPPLRGGEGDAEYRDGFTQVIEFSALLDPSDGVMIDISPNARGDNTLGTNDGDGHDTNPATGLAYTPQFVPAGDYYRVLAEFWADGPDSETPPGHWFTIANYVSDHPELVRRIGGEGEPVDALEWDVKLYLALGGAMHDVAIAAWGAKGWYDYVRPISAIRSMADLGQSTDPEGPSYHPAGIPLVPDVVEVVTDASSSPGQRHAHLRGDEDEHVGKIAVRAWRGPDFIEDPESDVAGVGWILAENWWPYQRPSFVTPPFAGYVSGHSTYSRAAAELLNRFTGSPFFPGGLGEFHAPRDEFLVFEDGPSVDITLQWATYADAADECSLSRIYGGIHPRADDIPGRLMGAEIGPDAFAKAISLFDAAARVRIRKTKLRRRGNRPDRLVVKGLLYTERDGPEDLLDVSEGMTVQILDALELDETVVLAEDDCKVTRKGRVKGRSADRSLTVRFDPKRRQPGVYAFTIQLRSEALGRELRGPLRLSIRTGDTVREGSFESGVPGSATGVSRRR